MAISFSCPFADFDMESGLESITLKSISSGDDGVRSLLRCVSLDSRNMEPTLLKSLSSGRMAVKRCVSFKESKSMAMLSQMSSSLEKEKLSVLDSKNPNHETKRRLAYCAVPAELSWWKLLDYIELERCSKSHFDIKKSETPCSCWSRLKTKVAKIGKGLSKNDKARKLALQHWLEAIDPRHRYGHNLHFYFEIWLQCLSREPFFYWLDIGEGKGVSLDDACPRSTLEKQCIKYLIPMERLNYEVIVEDGKFYKQTGELLHAAGDDDMKWIFVLNTSKTLYVGEKKKGVFQHSSFLAGGATMAAGKLVVENGTLKAISPDSGHYRPTKQNFNDFITFLKENNVDLTDVKVKIQNNEFFVKDFLILVEENKITFSDNGIFLVVAR